MTGDQNQRRGRGVNYRRNDLAYERRERNLSLEQVAKIVGIPASTLNNYERGRYVPPLIAALKLQILYRGQIASFYQPLYADLTEQLRAAELKVIGKRGSR